jgi:hypothetical protein
MRRMARVDSEQRRVAPQVANRRSRLYLAGFGHQRPDLGEGGDEEREGEGELPLFRRTEGAGLGREWEGSTAAGVKTRARRHNS